MLALTTYATSLVHGYSAQNYALGGVLVVRLLPALLLGPVAGVFADRFDRRWTMVISDLGRFLLFVTIPLARYFVSDTSALAWLLIASFLIECVSLFWTPAKDAAVPNLVRRDQFETANQLGLITTYGLTPVLGAGLFSVLSLITNVLGRHLDYFRTSPVTLALYLNAGTFLAGAVFAYAIPEIGGQRRSGPADAPPPSLRELFADGLRYIRHSRLVGGLIIGLIGAFVSAGAVIGAGKIFTASLGGGNAAYGVLFGSVFVGLGLGIAFGPKLARDLSRRRLFGLALVFAACCLILAAVMPQIVLAVIFVIGLGFGAGVAYLAATTLIGTEVESAMRGRIFAVLQSMVRVVLVIALAAVPFVVAGIGQTTLHFGHVHYVIDGTRIVLIAGGVFTLVAGLLAYRKMDDREKVAIWADVKASLRGDASARRRMRDGGLFIAFEGGEGSGKSTQLERLAARLRATGCEVVVTYEPGATAVGVRIRELLLHDPQRLSARAEALLFAVDRAVHVDTVVRPALVADRIVLTDRYIDSSLAYQGVGRRLTVQEVRRISRWATEGLVPDLTILLDVPAADGLRRARGDGVGDKVEAESVEFHERVRQAFRILAEASPRNHRIIDAGRSVDEVAAEVWKSVQALLAANRAPRPSLATRVDPRSEAVGTDAGRPADVNRSTA